MMTNEEMLQEIIHESKQYGKMSDPPIFFRGVREDHFNWLIERAERLQELGELIFSHAPDGRNYTNKRYVELLWENRRYKQALEFYADERRYHEVSEESDAISIVEDDNGEKARQALRGDDK